MSNRENARSSLTNQSVEDYITIRISRRGLLEKALVAAGALGIGALVAGHELNQALERNRQEEERRRQQPIKHV